MYKNLIGSLDIFFWKQTQLLFVENNLCEKNIALKSDFDWHSLVKD